MVKRKMFEGDVPHELLLTTRQKQNYVMLLVFN